MKARFEEGAVRLGPEGRVLYEQGGYGRPEKNGLRLAPEEVLYLVHRQRIEVEGCTFDDLLHAFSSDRKFLKVFLVYRDLRERGYAVQTGPQDFRVFRRGQRPGYGESLYLVRVLSERHQLDLGVLEQEARASSNLRKQYVLAVVDDEDELTYYEVRVKEPPSGLPFDPIPGFEARVAGFSGVVLHPPEELGRQWFGRPLDRNRLLLSPVEVASLARRGICAIRTGEGEIDWQEFVEMARAEDPELPEKAMVFTDLRERGLIPKTGYKFGHHFRVYCRDSTHSEMLVHAIGREQRPPMSAIARSVRLAHSVKKKMLFACVYPEGIRYIEFGRIKL